MEWDKLQIKTIIGGAIIVVGIVGGIYYLKNKGDNSNEEENDLVKLNSDLNKMVEETERIRMTTSQKIVDLEDKYVQVIEELKQKEIYAKELEQKLIEMSEEYQAATKGEADQLEQLKTKLGILQSNYDEVRRKLRKEEKRRNEIEKELSEMKNNYKKDLNNSDLIPCNISTNEEKDKTNDIPQQDKLSFANVSQNTIINWEKRTKIAEEIYDTEKSYVHSLSIMLEVFYKRFNELASDPDGCITQSDVKAIFSCAEIILNYNREFLKDLEKVIKNWDPRTSKLGSTFATISHFLKTYMTYVSNYSIAMKTLEKCKKDESFYESLQFEERDPRLKSMPLTGFLIMPVQRIPRYLLLLKELLKCTPMDHVDYGDLVIAHDQIATVALEVNEAERNAENLNTIYQIQTLLGGQVEETILEPHRRLIKHGKIFIYENVKKKDGYLILFNDKVIITKQKGVGLAYTLLKKENKLNDEFIEDGIKAKVILHIEIGKINIEPLKEELRYLLKTEKRSITIEFVSMKESKEWTSQFNETKEKQLDRIHALTIKT